MFFISTAGTEAGAREYKIKRLLLVLSLSERHVEEGLNTVEGFLSQYAIDDDAYTAEEVQACIDDLVADGLLTESA